MYIRIFGLLLLLSGVVFTNNISAQTDAEILQQAKNTGVTIPSGMEKQYVEQVRKAMQQKAIATEQNVYVPGTSRSENYTAGVLDTLSIDVTEYNSPKNKRFGADIFSSKNLNFAPNINIPTPKGYRLAAGDELKITVWGDVTNTYNISITPDGVGEITGIGPVFLYGSTIEEAEIKLKRELSTIHSGIISSPPTTFMSVSLGNIRSIKINVVGDVVAPGTYTVPSLASAFNALYLAGGVNSNGSLRDIRLFRNNKLISVIDVYDYLMDGKSNTDMMLQDNDMIIVSPYHNIINISGKVKRPMEYELKEGESLGKLINYAGGFAGDAYTEKINVHRKEGLERKIYSVDNSDYSDFYLKDTDEIIVGEGLNRYENRVEINGAVYRPGEYELNESAATVRTLIEKSEGVMGDAFPERSVIFRTRPDFQIEIISFNLKSLLSGDVKDIPLKRDDVVYIPSKTELQEEYTLTISGQVRLPGEYPYAENTTVEDLVLQAGGFKEAASSARVEVVRRIKNPDGVEYTDQRANAFTFSVDKNLALSQSASKFILQPFDHVYIRTSPGYQVQQLVSIQGEVLFPGSYAITNRDERVSDFIRKSGGFTPAAYIRGASLIRQITDDERVRLNVMKKITTRNIEQDSLSSIMDYSAEYAVGINLADAINNPKSKHDIILQEGDRLYVPVAPYTVKINGAVMQPNTVVYTSDMRLKSAVSQAGGFASRAKKGNSYVVYMNGTMNRTKSGFISRRYPAVEPGSEIIIPMKPERRGSFGETVGISSSIVSTIAVLIYALTR